MSPDDRDWERGEEPTRQMPSSGQGSTERRSGMSSGRKWAIGFVAAIALGLLIALVVLAADESGDGNGSGGTPTVTTTQDRTTQPTTTQTTTTETTTTTQTDTGESGGTPAP